MEAFDPYREAVNSVLPPELREKLAKIEAEHLKMLGESDAAKVRATEHIRTTHFDRPFEHMEADLEKEYAERVRYHQGKLAKKLRWLLEAWKDTPDEE